MSNGQGAGSPPCTRQLRARSPVPQLLQLAQSRIPAKGLTGLTQEQGSARESHRQPDLARVLDGSPPAGPSHRRGRAPQPPEPVRSLPAVGLRCSGLSGTQGTGSEDVRLCLMLRGEGGLLLLLVSSSKTDELVRKGRCVPWRAKHRASTDQGAAPSSQAPGAKRRGTAGTNARAGIVFSLLAGLT